MAPREKLEPDPNIKEEYVEVDLKKLPSFGALNGKVKAIVQSSSWIERYGTEWKAILISFSIIPFGLWCLSSSNYLSFALGMFTMSVYHGCIGNRMGHLAAHGALSDSKNVNYYLCKFFIEFIGSYSHFMGNNIHIQIHHPHTNIIGLGDSSSWKFPLAPCYLYMFVVPLLVPFVTPFVAFGQLVEMRKWKELVKFVITAGCGLSLHVFLLMKYAGFSSVLWSLACIFTYRSLYGIPYIHINIFQHIGLPMYSQDKRPVRIYQMSTGCLNLHTNSYLDFCFGRTLVDCHVEHHLFPRLGDNLCLKIKPTVRDFLRENGLPYNEDYYSNRMFIFLDRYTELMVDAPPFTHFIGLQ